MTPYGGVSINMNMMKVQILETLPFAEYHRFPPLCL